jgi:two-component system, LuxR family, sensor kinase FixL
VKEATIGRNVHSSKLTLAKAGALIAVIALLDWRVDLNVSFGFLYVFPMLLLGTVLSVWQITSVALVCTVLADQFDPFPFALSVLPQDILVLTALLGSGLFSQQVTKRRKAEAENLHRLETEALARREAEEQLEFLIDNSPAAIITMNQGGQIVLANPAAHRLFGVSERFLAGRNINRYIPALRRVTSAEHNVRFRTEMQCRGERENGDIFLANVFFSTYKTGNGFRLAALIVDASEELRDREEASLAQMLAGSRILAGAVSHEIRNICAAISVIRENLVRSEVLAGNKDFEALGSLIDTLGKIASLELRQSSKKLEIGAVDLRETLDDLRIVLESYCAEAGIALVWQLPDSLPTVRADRHSLLQVLLNLTKNSERALADAEQKIITISAAVSTDTVSIRLTDTGPGIASLEKLFQPFQRDADSTGLGLYLSRAFMRSFGGDLRHDPSVGGCSFVLDLVREDGAPDQPSHLDHYVSHTTFVA